MRIPCRKPASLSAALLSAAFAMAMTVSGQASAATQEVNLATPAQALAYCQSGKMPGTDIAYIAGGPKLVQYGPSSNCDQQVAKKIDVKKAIKVVGKHVSECNLSSPSKALAFCNDGAMGEWDIDYIAGKIGKSLSGPGYGCVINYSSSSIGNAICR